MHLSYRFTSDSKPAAWMSFDCCLSHLCTWSGIICEFRMSLREFLDPVVNRFTRQTLSSVNMEHLFVNIFWTEFCPQKTHNRKLLLGSRLLMLGRKFDYLNQPLSMHMRVSNLDYQERWNVPLPSGAYRKSIMSIKAVLLQFVIYLLTIPRKYNKYPRRNFSVKISPSLPCQLFRRSCRNI
jgi:hypothetical protein